MFHNYDPYEELERTKDLVRQLVDSNNNLWSQHNQLTRLVERQIHEIARLKHQIDQLRQMRELR